MKIEPMSVDTIRTSLHVMRSGDLCRKDCDGDFKSLILAWIHAEARARYGMDGFGFDDKLAEVKAEVGWPDGE